MPWHRVPRNATATFPRAIRPRCRRAHATADRMTDIIRDRYKDALAWLKDISAGRANLPPGPDGAGETLSQAAPEMTGIVSNEPLFKRGGW